MVIVRLAGMACAASARHTEMETRPIGPRTLGGGYIWGKNLLAHRRWQNHRTGNQNSLPLTPARNFKRKMIFLLRFLTGNKL
jgi:hypothetical protein